MCINRLMKPWIHTAKSGEILQSARRAVQKTRFRRFLTEEIVCHKTSIRQSNAELPSTDWPRFKGVSNRKCRKQEHCPAGLIVVESKCQPCCCPSHMSEDNCDGECEGRQFRQQKDDRGKKSDPENACRDKNAGMNQRHFFRNCSARRCRCER